MARPPKSRPPSRKPAAAPTAEAVYEMIAYMQRERHLVLHLAGRLDALEREVKRLAAEGVSRAEWDRLGRRVAELAGDAHRAVDGPPSAPSSPR